MPEILSIGELLDLGNSASTAGLIPYSALEFNGSGDISAISGSAIAGGVDTTIVSAIASSYVESGISGKVDQSAFDNCCSAMSSVVSSKLDASASSMFQPSGEYLEASASSMFQPSGSYVSASDMSAYVPFSGFEYSAGTQTITAISGSAIGGTDFDGVYTDNTLSGSGLSDSPLGVIHRNLVFGSSFIESTVGDTTTVNVNNDTIIKAVSSSAEATANGILYVVTGANI